MAHVTKFTHAQVFNQIRHIERTIFKSSNKDIDKSKLQECYSLTPDRDVNAWDYYKDRRKELHYLKRDDVKTLFGWVVTAPIDCPKELEDIFFKAVYNFLIDRYGEENCISCTVHKDESGSSHLHYLSIPVVEDTKKGGEKICCKSVLNKREMRNFHPQLQRYLLNNDIPGTVMSGITKKLGRAYTVEELKALREHGITIDKLEQKITTHSRWRNVEHTRNIDRNR